MRIALARTFIVAIVMVLLGEVAMAQSSYRKEIFGGAGAAVEFDFFSPLRKDVNIGGGFGFRPFSADRSPFLRMLGGEFEVNTTSTPSGQVTYYTGNLLLHAPIKDVEPYLVIGGGTAAHNGGHRALNAGVGLKLFLNDRVSLRPEFRGFYADDLSGFIRFSGAVGYHW